MDLANTNNDQLIRNMGLVNEIGRREKENVNFETGEYRETWLFHEWLL